jgi:hypothetical protein
MGIGQFAGNVNFDKLFSAGACPTVAEMQNIDYARLSGDWFL